MFVLQIIFGLSFSSVSAYVRFGRQILVEVLGRNEEWGDISSQLEKVHEETGGTCIVDSAFSKKKCNFLIKSSQVLPECAEEIVVNAEATAMRQSAEWE